MIRKLTGALVCLGFAVCMPPAVAQDDEAGASFTPVEIYTCKFNDRKSMRDLNKVAAELNGWIDARPQHRYSAVTLIPWYFGAEIEFDVAWLGWWPDGASMGVSNDDWIANGGALQEKFAAVTTCDQHVNFAALALKPPVEREVPPNGVLSFSDCQLKDGAAMGEALGALTEWGRFEKENGNHSALWAYFPVFGAGDVDYAFKLVEGFRNRTMLGEIYDWWGTDGAYEKAEEMYGDLVSCDSPRLYNFILQRDMNQ